MVRVESIKAIANAGNLKAFATVNIAEKIRISDIRVICQPGQKPWASMPSRAYESNGERKYTSTVELLDDTLKREVSEAVLAEYSKLDLAPEAVKPVPLGW